MRRKSINSTWGIFFSVLLSNCLLLIGIYFLTPSQVFKKYEIITENTQAFSIFDALQLPTENSFSVKPPFIQELPSPSLGVRLPPGMPANFLSGYGPHDAFGFRNQSIPGSVHVLFVGDSFTYGTGVDWDDTFPQIYTKLTQKSNYNISVPGWSMLQYTYIAKKISPLLNPNTILIAPYIGNDLAELARDLNKLKYWNELKNKWNLDGVLQYEKIRVPFKKFKITELNQEIYLYPENTLSRIRLDSPSNRRALDITLHLFKEFSKTLPPSTKLFLMPIPTKEFIYGRFINIESFRQIINHENNIFSYLEEASQKSGVTYIDLREFLIDQVKGGESLYLEKDSHFNRNGLQRVAEKLRVIL